MIEKIKSENELFSFGNTDIYSIRIMSLLKAYSVKYDFAAFYRQITDGEITAVFSRLDNDVTLSIAENADLLELEEFFTVTGFSSLLCDGGISFNFRCSEGVVMKSGKKLELHKSYASIDRYPKLMEMFNMLDYPTADFEAWYVDASHRIRHGCAQAFTLNVGGEIVSSAMFSSIYKNNAILSAVSTNPEFRNMGYASTLVSELICDFNGDVYLMREADKNESFYKRLGFENIGLWRMYK